MKPYSKLNRCLLPVWNKWALFISKRLFARTPRASLTRVLGPLQSQPKKLHFLNEQHESDNSAPDRVSEAHTQHLGATSGACTGGSTPAPCGEHIPSPALPPTHPSSAPHPGGWLVPLLHSSTYWGSNECPPSSMEGDGLSFTVLTNPTAFLIRQALTTASHPPQQEDPQAAVIYWAGGETPPTLTKPSHLSVSQPLQY